MLIAHTPLPANLFTNSSGGTLVAEASDLPENELGGLVQLYDDACDVGLVVHSTQLDRAVHFVLNSEHRDAEGEITHWELVPIAEEIRKTPSIAGLRIVLFND